MTIWSMKASTRRGTLAKADYATPVSEPNAPPGAEAHFEPFRGDAGAPRRRVVLTGADLTIADVEAVARHGASVALDVHARKRMTEARAVIEELVGRGEVVYGLATGFGDLASTAIPPEAAA